MHDQTKLVVTLDALVEHSYTACVITKKYFTYTKSPVYRKYRGKHVASMRCVCATVCVYILGVLE